MIEEHEFLMPEYYGNFRCKMEACRSACCEGWPIKISLADYFRLEGEECSDELKKRIDKGVRVLLHPTPDEYAEIVHDYEGKCYMRLNDGKCLVHNELGEDALSMVCKLYPRGIRIEPEYECSCANSCEAVVEMLISNDEPIKFVRKKLKMDMPSYTRRVVFLTFDKELEIRQKLIAILQNRSIRLTQRLKILGIALEELNDALKEKTKEKVNVFLDKKYVGYNDTKVLENDLTFGLSVMKNLMEFMDDRSISIRKYGQKALEYFSQDSLIKRYDEARASFESKFPKWEIWLEKLLVNHMFFQQFPFQDRKENPVEEFIAISSVYATIRFLGIGLILCETTKNDFVDMVSALFRLVEHTNYDRYSVNILQQLGVDNIEKTFSLIAL